MAATAVADRTYTEAEHLALSADAVTRETADLTAAKEVAETKVAELSGKVDVLEAAKVTEDTAKADLQKAFDDYKADIERLAEVTAAKEDRLAKVKAANASLADAYFTDERIQRWAEMSEEAFTTFVEDLGAAGGSATKAKETAAFSGGATITDPGKSTVGSLFAARRGEKK